MKNKFLSILLIIFLCVCASDAVAQLVDTLPSRKNAPLITAKRFTTYFTFSFPVGLGLYERFRATDDVDLMGGFGSALLIPYLSVPGIVVNLGSSIRLNAPDSSGNAYGLNFWLTHQFPTQSFRSSTAVALMWGRYITTNARFKWGLGLSVVNNMTGVLRFDFKDMLVIPAFELALRL